MNEKMINVGNNIIEKAFYILKEEDIPYEVAIMILGSVYTSMVGVFAKGLGIPLKEAMEISKFKEMVDFNNKWIKK